MADREIPMLENDMRFEDRGGAFVLVDPSRDGSHDVGSLCPEDDGRYAVRFGMVAPTPEPLPVLPREAGMRLLLDAYRIHDPLVGVRLDEQAPRFSFGFPQIVPSSGSPGR